MRKRLISLLLICVIWLSSLPTSVLGAEDVADEESFSTVRMSNEYLELVVVDDNNTWQKGRYYLNTIEGNPYYLEDNNKALLSNNLDNKYWGNFYVTVDQEQLIFIADDDSEIVVDEENDIMTSVMTYDGINITQKLEFVEGSVEGVNNMLKLSYIVENESDISHDVGSLLILDTALGENSGPYFKVYSTVMEKYDSYYGNRTYTYKTEGSDSTNCWYWDYSTWKSYGDTDDTLIGYGEVNTFGEESDDIQIVDLSSFYDEYDYYDDGYNVSTTQSILEDSGIVFSWDDRTLESNGSLTFGTLVGVYNKDTVYTDSYTLDNDSINNNEYSATVKIDDETAIYDNNNVLLSEVDDYYSSDDTFEDIVVEKLVQVNNEDDSDEVVVTYTVTNQGVESHEVGLRVMAEKSGNYFYVDGIGTVEAEDSFTDIPDYFECVSSSSYYAYTIDLVDETGTGESMDMLAFGRSYDYGEWSYSASNSYTSNYTDTAFMYWDPSTILPNETKIYTYTYNRTYDGTSATSKYDYLVSVMDEYGMPVEDAEITQDGDIYYTDSNGDVSMTAGSSDTFTISKKYYNSVSCTGGDPGETLHVTLYANTDDPFIESVEYEDTDGEVVDILTDYSSVYVLEDNVESITLSIDGNFGHYESELYEIIQDDEVIASSSSANITIAVSDLITYEKLYVRIEDSNGSYSTTDETGLFVLERPAFESGVPDLPGADFIFGGSTITLTVPDSVPIFGDESIDIGFEDLAAVGGLINIEDDGTVQIAIGTDITVAEDLAEFEKEFENASASSTNVSGADEVPYLVGSGSVSAEIMGYGEGYVDDDIMYVDLSMLFTISGDYEVTYQLYVGVIPVYFDGGVGASGSLEGTYELTYDMIDGWEVNGAVGATASMGVSATIEAGVGSSSVASISGEAAISLDYEYDILEDEQLLEATGSLTAKVKAFMFSKSKTIAEKTWTLYDTTTGYIENSELDSMIATYSDYLYEEEGFELIESENIFDINRFMIAGTDVDLSEVISYINSDYYINNQNIYPGTVPRLIHYDNKDFIFFIAEDDTRDTANRAKLMVTSRDLSESNLWSDAITIEEDGTADFNYDVSVDNDNDCINIVWQDMVTVLDDDVEMSEITDNVGITYATLSTTNSALTVQALSTSDYPMMPQITSYNGETVVTWTENDSDDIFASSGNNVIKKAEITITSTSAIEVIVTTDDVLASLDIGILDEKVTVAYGLDLDGDLYTLDDREIYIEQDGGVTRVTDDSVVDTSPEFVDLDGEKLLMWYRNGNIYYVSSADGDPEAVLSEDGLMYSDEFEVVSSSSETKIVWTEPGEGDETTSIMATNLYSDGNWSTPYALFSNDYYDLTVPNGYIDSEGDLELVGVEMDLDDDEWLMYIETVATYSAISITDVDYEQEDVSVGEELIVNVNFENVGQNSIDEAEVEITYDGTVIGTQTVNEEILIGDSIEIPVTVAIPEDISTIDYCTAIVTLSDGEYTEDNEYDFIIGYSDLELDTELVFERGTKYASITINNLTPFETDATLIITKDSLDGDTVAEYEISEIDDENFYNVLVDMTDIIEEEETNVYYAYVEASESEYYTYNNSGMIYFVDYFDDSEDSVDETTEENESSDNDEDDEDDEEDEDDVNETVDAIEYFITNEVLFDLKSNTEVPIKVFEELNDTENGVLYLNGNGYSFTFLSGTELDDTQKDEVDFQVNINKENKDLIILKFDNLDELPMSGDLTLELGKVYSGQIMILSSKDETGKIVVQKQISFDENGSVKFSVDSSQDYLISESIVLDNNIFKEDVKDIKILSGYEDGTFKPDQDMTRAEIAYVINTLVLPLGKEEEIQISDVSSWAEEAVSNIVNYGYMSLNSNGEFDSYDGMTRIEVIKMLYNILNLDTMDISDSNLFIDINTEEENRYVNACFEIGLINGYADEIRPYDNMTRAEFVTILNRFLSRDIENYSEDVIFKDLNSEHWAYEQIMSGIKE